MTGVQGRAGAVVSRAPGPRGSRVGGHFGDYRRDPLGFMARSVRGHGDAVPLRFGPYRLLLVADPSVAEQVFVTRARSFRRPQSMRPFRAVFGDSLLTTEGERWRARRQLLAPAFRPDAVQKHATTIVGVVDDALRAWADGQTRDVYRDMTYLTVGVVHRALFGTSWTLEESRIDGISRDLTRYFDHAFGGAGFLLPDALPTGPQRARRRARAQLEGIADEVLRERRLRPRDGDFVSMLLHASTVGGGRVLDGEAVRDEVITLLLTGHETTAITLAWAWWLVARHPRVDRALAEEVATVLGGRAPTAADLPQLRYASAVIHETLRLFPPAYVLAREAVEAVDVGGLEISRGTTVMASPWVNHRDARSFEDPSSFHPERWLVTGRQPHRGAFFPFGMGAHRCIAARFAMLEAVLVLTRIAQRYEMIPGGTSVPCPRVALRPHPGVVVSLRERRPHHRPCSAG